MFFWALKNPLKVLRNLYGSQSSSPSLFKISLTLLIPTWSPWGWPGWSQAARAPPRRTPHSRIRGTPGFYCFTTSLYVCHGVETQRPRVHVKDNNMNHAVKLFPILAMIINKEVVLDNLVNVRKCVTLTWYGLLSMTILHICTHFAYFACFTRP